MFTGEKFNCNIGAYYRFRGISDELCKKHNLVVIKHPKGKTPRDIYFAEKRGEPTKYNLMREALDKALSVSETMKEFKSNMYKLGYEIRDDFNLKYPTIRSLNSNKATRLYRLGEKYNIKNIQQILVSNIFNIPMEQKIRNVVYKPKENRFIKYNDKDSIVSIYADILKDLLNLFLYFIGSETIEENRNINSKYEPISPEMKEAKRKMELYSKRANFNELQNSVNLKDKDVFLIKYKNLMQELQNV